MQGLVWLLDCSANISDAQLDGFAAYGAGIGPEKACLRLLSVPLLTSIAAMPEYSYLGMSEVLMLKHTSCPSLSFTDDFGAQNRAAGMLCVVRPQYQSGDCCIKPCC